MLMSEKRLRKTLSQIIEPHSKTSGNPRIDILSKIYDVVLIIFIVASIVPLFFKHDPPIVIRFNRYLPIIFIIDYVLGWITADFQLKKKRRSFLLYPVTLWAVIDMLAIIPFFINVSETLVLFRVLRLFRISRLFKGLRYSDSFEIFVKSLKRQKSTLLSLLFITLAYIAISGLIVFHTEPDAFPSVLDAFFLAASLLTGVSIGDGVSLQTLPGQIIALVSSFWGVALIALPAGVVTGGFITELHNHQVMEKRQQLEEKRRQEGREDAGN